MKCLITNDFKTLYQSFLQFWIPWITFELLGYDINNAMNVYSAWLERDVKPDVYVQNYTYFIKGFPNPNIPLAELLSRI